MPGCVICVRRGDEETSVGIVVRVQSPSSNATVIEEHVESVTNQCIEDFDVNHDQVTSSISSFLVDIDTPQTVLTYTTCAFSGV